MRTTRYLAVTTVAALLIYGSADLSPLSGTTPPVVHASTSTPNPGVAPQYDTTHVYVSPEDFDRFVASLLATFGGTATQARRLYRDTNSEQHDVATGLDTGGNRVGVWFQDASSLSIRRGADGLSGDRSGWSDPKLRSKMEQMCSSAHLTIRSDAMPSSNGRAA